jgi:hypothetical protein
VLLFLLIALHIISGLIFGPLVINNMTYYAKHNCFALERFPNESVYWAYVSILLSI